MDIRILEMDLTKLNPAKYNPRKDLKPGDKEYEALKKSILKFGCVEPIVYNERLGNIVGGHQRRKVCLDIGKTRDNCVVVDLDEHDEKILNIALNKISGEWDMPKLKDLLLELDTGALDITLTGFDENEIEMLMLQTHRDEALDLDDDNDDIEKVKTCHCPKCGFEFEVKI